MTGLAPPAQTELETTRGQRSRASDDGAAVAVGVGVATADGVGLGLWASSSTARTTAVIVSASVPNGNRARSCPAESMRKTSAVCDIV